MHKTDSIKSLLSFFPFEKRVVINEWRIHFLLVLYNAEYCDRYAKKENITSTPTEDSDDEVSDDDISDGQSASSEDDVARHADP